MPYSYFSGTFFCTNTQSNNTNLRTVTAALIGSNTEVLISISLASTLSNYTLDGLHLDDRHDMTIIIGQFVCLGFCSSSFFMLPGASPMLLENMPNGLLASFIFYFSKFEKSCCHQLVVVLDPECNPVDPNPLQSITLFPGSFAGSVFARNIHRAASPHNTTLFTNFRAAVRSLRSPHLQLNCNPGMQSLPYSTARSITAAKTISTSTIAERTTTTRHMQTVSTTQLQSPYM